jgi:hypothetical protein
LERSREEERFEAKLEPLVTEIEKSVVRQSGSQISPSEKRMLNGLFKHKDFKVYVESFVISKHGTKAPHRKIFRDADEAVNAFQTISEVLGITCGACFYEIFFNRKTPTLEADRLEKYYTSMLEKDNSNFSQELIEGLRQYRIIAAIVETFPEPLLEKLSHLWAGSSAIFHGYLLDHYLRSKEQEKKSN